MDANGNVICEKEIGKILGSVALSKNNNNCIYACLDDILYALDEKMDIIWTHKPKEGFIIHAPVNDEDNNLFCTMSGNRLLSLDSHGNTRWVAKTKGDTGFQPCICSKGYVLTATSEYNHKPLGEEEISTYLEIFDNNGNKSIDLELVGTIFYSALYKENQLIVATNCSKVILEKEILDKSVKVSSVILS
jgi:hypothetical protein